MCGIVGIIYKNKQEVTGSILEKMASTIHHRGPDEDGIFINGNIGFFHKRLSIIDLSTGQQPMTFDDCTYCFQW